MKVISQVEFDALKVKTRTKTGKFKKALTSLTAMKEEKAGEIISISAQDLAGVEYLHIQDVRKLQKAGWDIAVDTKNRSAKGGHKVSEIAVSL